MREKKSSGEGGFVTGVGGGKVLDMVTVEGEGVEGTSVVRVGEVRVPLERVKGKGIDVVDEGAVLVRKGGDVGDVLKKQQVPCSQVGRQRSIQKLLRMYRSQGDDLLWARNGCTETVTNDEVIPVVQN